ncbi:MAG TPA: transcription elongation factor GreA [Chloroflexia bacterium]|nr:transcription elongation factor GreA [Chloroflexia bacterium]
MVDRDKPCYLTPAGKVKLEQELAELRTVRRPALSESIRQLNGFGGSSETELDEFMNEQSQLDAHIKDLEFVLRHAIIIAEGALRGDKVEIGCRVTVRDSAGEEIPWTIVGSAEANTRQGKISNESLVGAALMGHRVGDVVTVTAPAGPQAYTILKIE